MDPLSVTASIIAVLQLSAALTTHINEIRHATSDQKKVAVEAGNLYSLLINLRFRVEDARSDDPWFNQVKLLSVNDGPLTQFKHILEKMVEEIHPLGTRDRVKSVLTWKWTKREVEEALKEIERLKTLITIALTNDAFKLSQAIHGELATLVAHTSALRIGVEQLKAHASGDLQDRLSRWLQVPDSSSNFQAALAKRHAQTGSWFLQSSPLRDWKSSTSSFLWLHGNAGCGKTVLSATALKDILYEANLQPGAVVAYFYFDFNSTEKQHTRSAIRSLLFQLALQLPDCLHALEQSYQQCHDGYQQLSEDTIRSILHSALALPNRTYVVLDALDECTDRDILLPFVHDLVVSHQHRVCILATSRRERDIEEQLKPVAHHVVNVQSAVVDPDISIYVHDRLTTDTKLKKWPPPVKDEIAGELMKKANGMFRWVYCQLEALRKCVKLSALRKALSLLPETLDETYTRILEYIKSNDQLPDAISVLRWLCFCDRPLNLSEVVDILAIENGKEGGFRAGERLPDPADVMTICSSLISCDEIQVGNEPSDQTGRLSQNSCSQARDVEIRLAHFSVKEYLLSDRCSVRSDFEEQTCHQAIAEGSLHYLLHLGEQVLTDDATAEEYPLARYAAENWWQHAASSDSLSGTAVHVLTRSLLTDETQLLTWVRHYNVDQPWKGYNASITAKEIAPPLYYAAWIGLLDTVGSLLDNGADVNSQGGKCRNALHAASARGHEKVVQILLDKGADVNAHGAHYGNALQAASDRGHEKVVQILLDKGVDVNAQGGHYGNALQGASAGGHEKVVQILLDEGADVDAQGGAYGNALQAASDRGHEKVVQILLDKGADVNAQGGVYGNALQAASARGDEKVVQMLLDNGADVNAQGAVYGNVLQAASAGGNEKVVQILLDKGVDINAQGGEYGNALQAASAGGHEKVVQILLDKGADVNAQGGVYGNALQAASAGGHEKVVQILLDNGADVNAQGGVYGNVLQAASAGGNEKVVQILLDKGVDINAHGGEYGNALQAASDRGHEKVVQILLDEGADVDAQGGHYGNALQAASVRGDEKVVQILLDKGADVNAQGGVYGNALQGASARGDEKVVQILLDEGVDVNAQGGLHGNALQAASAGGNEKVVQILLDKGADVNAQGGIYGNALQAASAGDNEKVVQMLLDKGADVNAQGGHYGNALQAASDRGDEKVVQILLDKGVDVNAQGGHYGNALQGASARGDEKVVQMLLDKGVDVNAQGGHYGNALHAASDLGDEKVVQILLDEGADVNAQGGECGNALHAASARGHEKVVQILLDKGADVSAHGGLHGNALQAASAGGHEKVVQILLDKGADVNAQGGHYGNTL